MKTAFYKFDCDKEVFVVFSDIYFQLNGFLTILRGNLSDITISLSQNLGKVTLDVIIEERNYHTQEYHFRGRESIFI